MAETNGLWAQERYYPVWLLAFSGLLYFLGLGSRDFWAPVEPRYGEIVRVMFAHDQWIVPMVNGELYTDKPILYFWVALAAAHLWGGVNEWIVRLPAALGAIGFVMATYLIGREFFSERVGALAALVFATSFRVIWEARWAHLDTLFGFFFTMTVFFGARALFRRAASHEILLAYVFMGLATLTKGLIGVVLPGLLLVAFVVARQDRSVLRRLRLPSGLSLFLFITTPWFFLVNRATHGKWLADFIYIHHFQRYTAGAGHRQPFYYYLTTLPADFLPWTTFLVPALMQYRKNWRRPETIFFVLWFAVVFVFFSMSNTKRDLYLLPLFPPLALLVACYMNDLAERDWTERNIYFWLSVGFFASAGCLGLALPIAVWIKRPDAFAPLLPPAGALFFGGLAISAAIVCRQTIAAVVSTAAMMLVLTGSAAFAAFPFLEQFKSYRSFSAEINRLVPQSAPLYVFADTTDDFNYYTNRPEIPVLKKSDDIARLGDSKGKSYLLIKQRELKALGDRAAGQRIAQTTLGNTTWYLLALGQ